MPDTKDVPASWEVLLRDAVEKPGRILEAYTAFHGYSLGNQLLAMFQCSARGIATGPIATFQAWKDKGRSVRKGEKALTLCMPITIKRESKDATKEDGRAVLFVYRPRWFALSQTDGANVPAPVIPAWDQGRALTALEIESIPFDMTDGNVQGYARGRSVAINPVAQVPVKTLFHELGHVMLEHTVEAVSDTPDLPRSLKEAEAEAVALLCLESLGLPGADYCRGYVQSWYKGDAIPEASARRIFKAADAILKAGRESVAV